MKYLIVLSVLLVVALAYDPHGLKAAHEKCHMDAPEVKSKPSSSSESGSHEGHHTHKSGHHNEHSKCVAKELGLVNDEGKIVVDGVKLHVGHVITEADKIQEIVKACAQDKDSVEATAEHVVKCLYKKQVFAREDKHHGGLDSEENDSTGHHHSKHHHVHGSKPATAHAEV